MKSVTDMIIITFLIIANVIMIGDSLFDYKMDKILDVDSDITAIYIYKK